MDLKIVDVKVSDLKPAEYNPRAMTEKEANDLESSLTGYGMVEPIVVNGSKERFNVVIGGHQRLTIWKKTHNTIPVVYVNIPDIKREQELNVRLNKNVGHWDYDLLANFENELLELAGFASQELDKIFKKEPAQDEPPAVDLENSISISGQIYQLGRHRLMCGDATKPADVGLLMGGGQADMVFTDPPYNVDYTGKTKDALKVANDKMEGNMFYEFLFDSFKNLFSFTKDGASIYVCHADTERVNFTKAFIDANFKLAQVIIWAKDHFVLGRQDYQWQHEPILYGWKEGNAHYFVNDKTQTTVWNIKRPSASREHPTMKPLELMIKALTNSSKRNDIVLDTFGGSGSTLIACEQTDRTCYMAELDEHYVDVIRKRYWKFINKTEDGWQEGTKAV